MAIVQQHGISDEEMWIATDIVRLINEQVVPTKEVRRVYIDYVNGAVVFDTVAGISKTPVDEFVAQCMSGSTDADPADE